VLLNHALFVSNDLRAVTYTDSLLPEMARLYDSIGRQDMAGKLRILQTMRRPVVAPAFDTDLTLSMIKADEPWWPVIVNRLNTGRLNESLQIARNDPVLLALLADHLWENAEFELAVRNLS